MVRELKRWKELIGEDDKNDDGLIEQLRSSMSLDEFTEEYRKILKNK